MSEQLRDILSQMRKSNTYLEMIDLTQQFIDIGMNSGGDERGSIAIQFIDELTRMKRMILSPVQE